MKAIIEINNWFTNGKDYDEGVLLYDQHGISRGLKRILKKGPSSYNSGKLESELQKLLSKYQIKPVKKKKAKVVRTKTVQKSVIQDKRPEIRDNSPVKRYSDLKLPGYDFESLPEQLKYETMLRIKLFKEAEAHHYRLDSLKDPVEIKKSIDIILQNFEKVDRFWERLDYWGKYKIILPAEDPEEKKKVKEYTNPFEMIKRRNNLRSNLTKARNKLRALKDNQKIADLQQKIGHWEIEKADLDKKIEANG